MGDNRPNAGLRHSRRAAGGLGLSGNNDGFTGKITVRKDASLSAKAESLPVNHPVNGNVGNIDLTNGGTLIFEQDDNGSYQGRSSAMAR